MKSDSALGISEPKSRLATLPLTSIRKAEEGLRNVDREADGYLELCDSVAVSGVLVPIVVREDIDPDTSETFYWLVDGLQRYTASLDSGKVSIDAKIVTMSDLEVLEAQIITNIHKLDTTPVQYSKQLVRIMHANPTMTIPSLAHKLSRSISWVSDRMGLLKLNRGIAELVDSGRINMTNAYNLSKLPADEQEAFVDRALTLQPVEFVPLVNSRAKELKEAARQGRAPKSAEFVPVAHLQKLSEIKDELNGSNVANILINHTGTDSPFDAFKLAIQWVLHLDPLSIEKAKTDEAARLQKITDDKERRKQERDMAKREKALAGTPAA